MYFVDSSGGLLYVPIIGIDTVLAPINNGQGSGLEAIPPRLLGKTMFLKLFPPSLDPMSVQPRRGGIFIQSLRIPQFQFLWTCSSNTPSFKIYFNLCEILSWNLVSMNRISI